MIHGVPWVGGGVSLLGTMDGKEGSQNRTGSSLELKMILKWIAYSGTPLTRMGIPVVLLALLFSIPPPPTPPGC